jgi:hypothetical protein
VAGGGARGVKDATPLLQPSLALREANALKCSVGEKGFELLDTELSPFSRTLFVMVFYGSEPTVGQFPKTFDAVRNLRIDPPNLFSQRYLAFAPRACDQWFGDTVETVCPDA